MWYIFYDVKGILIGHKDNLFIVKDVLWVKFIVQGEVVSFKCAIDTISLEPPHIHTLVTFLLFNGIDLWVSEDEDESKITFLVGV